MNYDEALWYLEQMDTVLAGNTQYTDAINKAKDALLDCLELGLNGDDEESTRAGP